MNSALTTAHRLFVLVATVLISTAAQGDSLDGTWKATSLRVSWSIGDWSKECGPRPQGGGEQGGTVSLSSAGSGFKLSGLGRNYTSTECWEQMPGLKAISRSVGKTAIQATCTMPPGDPRRAKVTTSWYPKGDTIQFDETGQYQFVVGKSTCTASVRRVRTLSRVKSSAAKSTATSALAPTGESKSTPAASSPPPTRTPARATTAAAKPPPPPEQTSACRKPGPPVRLEVTPRMKLMRAGETFQFLAVARDKNGCRSPVKTAWSLIGQSDAQLSPTGLLSVPEKARGAQIEIEASVSDKAVRVGARIVSASEFEELLAGGSYGTWGESFDAAEVNLASGYVELDETKEKPAPSKSPLLWLLGALVVTSLGVTLVLLHRSRREKGYHAARASRVQAALDGPSEVPAVENPASHENQPTRAPRPENPTASVKVAPEPSLKRLCPVCGKRYDADSQFCPEDGARLMRVN